MLLQWHSDNCIQFTSIEKLHAQELLHFDSLSSIGDSVWQHNHPCGGDFSNFPGQAYRKSNTCIDYYKSRAQ